MAIHTTQLAHSYPDEQRLSAAQLKALTHCATMVNTAEESKALAKRHGPMVILSASGMATGGRVLHHLALYASNKRNMIVLTGFQAPGTRGASLANHTSPIRIHGRPVEVRAEVVQLQSASAHADATQLMAWLQTMPEAPRQTYIVHGEMNASDELRKRINHELGWRALVPEHGSTWPL